MDFIKNGSKIKILKIPHILTKFSKYSMLDHIYFSMCIFTWMGLLPRKWKMLWNGLKIEIYDFNNFSCYLKKMFSFMRWSLLWASSPEYIYTLIQSVFSPYRVSEKMENAMKWAKILRIWLQSVHLLGDPVWWKFTLSKFTYVFGTKGSQKAQPHKLFLREQL